MSQLLELKQLQNKINLFKTTQKDLTLWKKMPFEKMIQDQASIFRHVMDQRDDDKIAIDKADEKDVK